ncbi:NAD(P)/FAD-dependent oxidoreductase [Brevundimonas sp. 2R-24]|uniref:Thioredoxin reductase n=1 Tax=Peiella sedimenti TaxID=3061083 RepID=A0ABT8SHR3_9CAUL|nr:NAD(P)/FAD-dependent oxidoreductase [Caulobacteraceae bacterium XZ-24]
MTADPTEPSPQAPLDVLVVGAGPGGLAAATYLARFRRRVLVADGGEPRAGWIPVSHNMPGFPQGIAGKDILARMREQAEEYGAVIQPVRVERLTPDGDHFVADLAGRQLRARAVVLATGVEDRLPPLPGLEDAIRRSLVRICPICDGYEATGKRVAVLGRDDMGVREAAFLRTFTRHVTLVHMGPPEALTERRALEEMGATLIEGPVEAVRLNGDHATALCWGGQYRDFDFLYSALGTRPNAGLAETLGAARAEDGRLTVDEHQRTSVKGLYACGDVVRGLNQIAVATAEAAVAATAIHNALREADGWTVD